jgi:hypothetical protein
VTTIHECNDRSIDETVELTALRPVLHDEDDSRPPASPREPSRILTRLGWLLAAVAVAGAVTLAVVALREPTNAQRPITDAKDHPGYGPIPLGPVQRPITDAKDHPGYGPIPLGPVQRPITDAKDHPGYGPAATTCPALPGSNGVDCPAG